MKFSRFKRFCFVFEFFVFLFFYNNCVVEVNFPKDVLIYCEKVLASLPFADHVEGLTKINKSTHKLELVPEKTHIC